MTIEELSKALKILNEAAAQRADFSKYQYEPVEETPEVYPNALGKPILNDKSKRELRKHEEVARIFPQNEHFWIGRNSKLQLLGVKNGEVYITGGFLRKEVCDKKRFRVDEVIDTMRAIISSPLENARVEPQRNKGKELAGKPKVVRCDVPLGDKTYRLIIARKGALSNCIVTLFEI